MKTKKTGKPSAANKATVEFVILILTAAILFSIATSLGLSDKFYRFLGTQRYTFDAILTGAGFFAAAIAVFAFRRWFELRRTYKKLAQSDEQLRFQAMLLDEIGDSVLATDLEGKIVYVNQAQCNWKNKNKDELLGQSVRIFDMDNSIEQVQREIISATLEKGGWSGEIVSRTANGGKLIVECRTWLMKNKSGKSTGICGVTRDVTERKERDRELLKHKRYLEALDAASGILLHSIEEIKYDEFLAVLGPASDADRVHIFLKVDDENLRIPLRRKTQWCRNEKIPPVPTELTENRFFGKIYPQWQKTLVTGRHICLSTENFPPQQLDFWESLHIKALLIVPVLIDNQLNGFMSFDNCTETRQWTESEIEFLRTAAVDLAFAIKRLEIKEELKKQRDFAQKLIETAPTIVLVLDKDANIVTFNPYFEKLSGRRLEEVKGKNWFDTFLPEEDRQKIHKIFATAITNTSTRGNVNPIVAKDGHLRYIEWFDKTLKDEKGNVTGLLSTGQDITERLKAEEELKDSEARFKTIFDDSFDGILLVDTETRKFQIYNKMIREMLGYTEKEMTRLSVNDIHSEKDLPHIIETFERLMRGEIKLADNIPVKRKNGSVFYADIIASPTTLGGRKYLMGSFRDITERKQVEEALKKSEANYRAIFDTANDAIFLHDPRDGKILDVNQKMCEMFSYTHDEVVKNDIGSISEGKPPYSQKEAVEWVRKASESGPQLFEWRTKDKFGRLFWSEVNLKLTVIGGENRVMAIVRDITERKQAEEELKKAHSELEQRVIQRTAALQQINAQLVKTIEERNRIQKMLQETEKLAGAGKLAAQIAHEINNPIAGIKNSFLLIKDAVDKNHQYFEYVGRIEKEIDRVSQIVRQMFDLYRPDTRSADKFKVCEAIKDITELLKIASQEKQIHIEVDCPHNAAIILSEALFRQVIYNIVQNAIQASPPQGIVKITALIDNSRLNMQVSDEGHGVDEKIRDRIFEPFFTTGSGGPGSGIGLGLSITKDIISAMDGTIDFTSKKDKGTVFNISIPIGNEPAK